MLCLYFFICKSPLLASNKTHKQSNDNWCWNRDFELTSEKPYSGSCKSSAVGLNSRASTHMTAGLLLKSSPPKWVAPGLSESCSVDLWPEEAQAAPWGTASGVRLCLRAAQWTGTLRPYPTSPTESEQCSHCLTWHRNLGFSMESQRSQDRLLTRSAFTRTIEPDFLNRPSVSKCPRRHVQASTRKLRRQM